MSGTNGLRRAQRSRVRYKRIWNWRSSNSMKPNACETTREKCTKTRKIGNKSARKKHRPTRVTDRSKQHNASNSLRTENATRTSRLNNKRKTKMKHMI